MKKIIFLIIVSILSIGIFLPNISLAVDAPTIMTIAAENIELRAANLRGEVARDGGASNVKVTVWLEYGLDIKYGSTTEKITRVGNGAFSIRAADLAPCKTYHFRAVGNNGYGGNVYGADKTFKTQCASFDVILNVQDVTLKDTLWYTRRVVLPGDYLKYQITVKSTTDIVLTDITAKVVLPSNVAHRGNLIVKDQALSSDITADFVNVGNLLPGESKIITFEAEMGALNTLYNGQNTLVAKATVQAMANENQGTCALLVFRNGGPNAPGATNGAGNPTAAPTGIGDTIFNSLLLPLLIAGILVWIFKSQLLGVEKLIQSRKQANSCFKAKKELARKINTLKGTF